MKNDSRIDLNSKLVFAIVALAVVTRIVTPGLLGHPSNFAPVSAIALFCGAYLESALAACLVPLIAVAAGDLILDHFFLGHSFFYPGWYWQYGCYLLIAGIGMLLKGRIKAPNVASASLSSSIVFFLVTNFGVWLSAGMYPMTALGLVACYTAAIPFFGPTLAGDLFYSALMFGSVELAKKRSYMPARAL
jgi:hypothetical protein